MLTVQRVQCAACSLIRQVNLGFADPRKSDTRTFERYALELSRKMAIRATARHLDVNWGVIKDIWKRYLKRRFFRPKLRGLKLIAIDEISFSKGHRHLNFVLELRSNALVSIGDGKGAKALQPFWKRLHASRARIRAVAKDRSPAHIQAGLSHVPEAKIVFDHYHIIKMFNDKLSDLLRKWFHEVHDVLQKRGIKGTRWPLLKKPENLDAARAEPRRLREALKLNQPLATTCCMKEELRQLWKQPDKDTAKPFLAS